MAQQFQLLGGLGIIPTYQFSHDPAVNPYGVNPHVKFPEGWNQLTVQPVGQYVTSGEANLQGLRGLGARIRDRRRQRTAWTQNVARTAAGCSGQCWPGCTSRPDCSCDCPERTRGMNGLGILMVDPEMKPQGIYTPHRQIRPNGLGFFDSTWWSNRKWLAFGIVGILGIGAAALATKVLR